MEGSRWRVQLRPGTSRSANEFTAEDVTVRFGGLVALSDVTLTLTRTSTTLADLLTPLPAANPFSTVWASLRW